MLLGRSCLLACQHDCVFKDHKSHHHYLCTPFLENATIKSFSPIKTACTRLDYRAKLSGIPKSTSSCILSKHFESFLLEYYFRCFELAVCVFFKSKPILRRSCDRTFSFPDASPDVFCLLTHQDQNETGCTPSQKKRSNARTTHTHTHQ